MYPLVYFIFCYMISFVKHFIPIWTKLHGCIRTFRSSPHKQTYTRGIQLEKPTRESIQLSGVNRDMRVDEDVAVLRARKLETREVTAKEDTTPTRHALNVACASLDSVWFTFSENKLMRRRCAMHETCTYIHKIDRPFIRMTSEI